MLTVTLRRSYTVRVHNTDTSLNRTLKSLSLLFFCHFTVIELFLRKVPLGARSNGVQPLSVGEISLCFIIVN